MAASYTIGAAWGRSMTERLSFSRSPAELDEVLALAPDAKDETRTERVELAAGEVAPADDLISRAATGDTAAFRALYLRHRSDVARLVFRMLGARSDLDDVVQEVFFQVFRSLKDFRGQAKFSTWLHRVTVNVVLMHRRAAKSRPTYTEEAPADISEDHKSVLPDEAAARHERMRAFSRLLDRLADKKRIVFVLHELEGLLPAEIAKVVGAPVLTVRTRLFYARREIESMLCEEPSLAALQSTFAKTSDRSEKPETPETRDS